MEVAQQIAFVPQTAMAQAAGQATGPASAARPDSIARFQTLMFAPEGAATNAAMPNAATESTGVRVQSWAEGVSSQWKGFDQAVQKMMATKDLSPKELLSLQYEMTKASVSLELTSKSAGMVERNVQTLTQRS
jgi:Type III secretion basal body protein I, YscI, HrpB, PscI